MGILTDVCEKEGIEAKFFYPKQRGEALAIKDHEKRTILIDKDGSLWEKRLSLAHELAHHIFGHLDHPGETFENEESEARMFSAAFVALLMFAEYGGFNSDKADSKT